MTPERQKPKKLANANNYDIGDIKSDDSTDDESAPKKRIPPWAQGMFLVDNLHEENFTWVNCMGYRFCYMNVSSNSPFDGNNNFIKAFNETNIGSRCITACRWPKILALGLIECVTCKPRPHKCLCMVSRCLAI